MDPSDGAAYSTAYDRLVGPEVDGSADVVGLLAYAFYKRDKRELARSGEVDADGLRDHHRMLTKHLVDQYRDSSLRSLEIFASEVVDKATPQIQDSTRTEEIRAAKEQILREIKSTGSPFWSVFWNIIGWLITLAITFIVAVGTGRLSLTITPG